MASIFNIFQRSPEGGGEPERPIAFGQSCTWLALKTTDTVQVVKALGLKKAKPCNWTKGLEYSANGLCFVTPPVDGWTLVVSSKQLPLLDGTVGRVYTKRLLERLSITFGEAQYFASYTSINVESWARARHGNVGRIFHRTSILLSINEGNAGEGETTTASAAAVAGLWSVNPLTLWERTEKGMGVAGRLQKV